MINLISVTNLPRKALMKEGNINALITVVAEGAGAMIEDQGTITEGVLQDVTIETTEITETITAETDMTTTEGLKTMRIGVREIITTGIEETETEMLGIVEMIDMVVETEEEMTMEETEIKGTIEMPTEVTTSKVKEEEIVISKGEEIVINTDMVVMIIGGDKDRGHQDLMKNAIIMTTVIKWVKRVAAKKDLKDHKAQKKEEP